MSVRTDQLAERLPADAQPPMAAPQDEREPDRHRVWMGIAISIASVAACVWWAAGQDAPHFPDTVAGLGLVALSLCAYVFSTLARGWRWHVILRRAHVGHDRADAYGLTVVGYMGNTVLPARGGEVLRILLLSARSGARRREVLGSIIPERMLDAAALAVLFAGLTFMGTAGAPTGRAPAIVALGGVVVAAIAGLIYLRLRIAGRLAGFADRVRPVARASRLLLTRSGIALGALSLTIWMSEATVFWLATRSLDVSIAIYDALFVIVLGALAAMIPAGPGFVGTYDAAMLFGLHALSVGGGTALSCVLLFRFVVFVPITLVGLGLMLARYGGLSRLRRAGTLRLSA